MQVQALLQGQLVVSVREADGTPVDATGVLAGRISLSWKALWHSRPSIL